MKSAKRHPNADAPVLWHAVIWIIAVHLCGAFGAWYLWAYFHAGTLALALCMFILVHLSISAGLHRLYSHRSYRATKPLELFLVLFSAAAFQASIIVWAYQHRIHHEHSDTDKDPYSVEHGFWWAHMGWIWRTKVEVDPAVVKDLHRNKVLVWQTVFTFTRDLILCSARLLRGCYEHPYGEGSPLFPLLSALLSLFSRRARPLAHSFNSVTSLLVPASLLDFVLDFAQPCSCSGTPFAQV